MLKTLATALNKSKKRKGFFLLDLKRHHYARVTSVASAERDATLMDFKSMLFLLQLRLRRPISLA
jgi:hypothetical protein